MAEQLPMRLIRPDVSTIMLGLASSVGRIPADSDAAKARRWFFDAKLAIFATLAHAWSQEGRLVDPRSAADHFIDLGILDAQSPFGDLVGSETYDEIADLSTELRPGDLGALYQQVLQSDLSREGGQYRLIVSKASRDSSGAYYTPQPFAQEITRHSIDRLIRERTGIRGYSRRIATSTERATVDSLLANSRVADLSCGAGDFLVAVLDYAREYTGVAEVIARNIWGIDVDPIALIIAAAEIEYRTGEVPNLVLGNPLLGGTEPASIGKKAELFAVGRIYASGMMLVPDDTYPSEGFDLILGNPPWEKVRFESRKTRELLGQDAHTESLTRDLTKDYREARSLIARNGLLGHAPRGEANTYALFPVLGTELLRPDGVMALVLKSAIATSPVNSALFSWLRKKGGLREIHLFENRLRIFAIDAREKFCVGLFTGDSSDALDVSVGNTKVVPLDSLPIISVSDADLWAMYPSTGTLPNVRTTSDFRELQDLCARLPRFGEQYPAAKFGRIVHLTSHAGSIEKVRRPGSLPILEGKFIGPYTVRAATFDGIEESRRYSPKAHARRTSFEERLGSKPEARYYIDASRWRELAKGFDRRYMLCWRSLTSATNARTTIAAIAPFGPGVQSVQFLQLPDDRELSYLLGLFNSMVFDHLVRSMIPGIDLTQSVVRQIPVPRIDTLEREVEFGGSNARLDEHIMVRIERLLLHDPDTVEFVEGVGARARPLSESAHLTVITELDELFFRAYELDPEGIDRVRGDFRPPTHSAAVKTP